MRNAMPPEILACPAPVPARPGRLNWLRKILFIAPVIMLCACDNADTQTYQPEFSATADSGVKEYIFGVHPQRNPKKLRAVFGPLVKYINSHVSDANLVFEASRNFEAFDQKLAERQFDFVLPNPYGTVKGIESGYKVFGQMGNKNDLRGLILVRRDSHVKTVADLKGHDVCFPGPTALAATLLPKYFLHTQGLAVNADFKSVYVGSMESSLMNVYRRNVVAGTAYPPAWRDFSKELPQVAAQLKVMWETDPMPDNSLMARDDVPQELVDRVAQAIFNMHNTDEGRAVLQTMDLAMFKPSSNEDYAPVRNFLKKYEAEVGPVNQAGISK
jgi:phosphonate transport system substrate-binding protein